MTIPLQTGALRQPCLISCLHKLIPVFCLPAKVREGLLELEWVPQLLLSICFLTLGRQRFCWAFGTGSGVISLQRKAIPQMLANNYPLAHLFIQQTLLYHLLSVGDQGCGYESNLVPNH